MNSLDNDTSSGFFIQEVIGEAFLEKDAIVDFVWLNLHKHVPDIQIMLQLSYTIVLESIFSYDSIHFLEEGGLRWALI